MTVHLIAGMPAAGKDTLADIIEGETDSRKVSMSRDVLRPQILRPDCRKKLEEELGIDLPFNPEEYPLTRDGYIRLGDDLNRALQEEGYHHFSDMAVEVYGRDIVIPSFRQAEMLPHLEEEGIQHRTYLIRCPTHIRHQRWKKRDGISEEEMRRQERQEKEKYWEPLKTELTFDHVINNSGSIRELEAQALKAIS